MTSDQGRGQGEPSGGPGEGASEGPPQGWNAPPPPQQGWNAPPEGWNQPPPQSWNAPPPAQGWQAPAGQQWPGTAAPYVPPSPPGSGERPETVRFGVGAMLAGLVLGVIQIVVAFSDLDAFVLETMETAAPPSDIDRELVRSVIVGLEVFLLVLAALFALFLWFAWQGRHWARVAVLIMSGIYAANLLSGISSTSDSGFVNALSVFIVLLVVAGFVLLVLKPSQEWYRYTGWERTYGQHR